MCGCQGEGGNQFFALTTDHTIVNSQEFCVGTNDQHYAVITVNCDKKSQTWTFLKEVFVCEFQRRKGTKEIYEFLTGKVAKTHRKWTMYVGESNGSGVSEM